MITNEIALELTKRSFDKNITVLLIHEKDVRPLAEYAVYSMMDQVPVKEYEEAIRQGKVTFRGLPVRVTQ